MRSFWKSANASYVSTWVEGLFQTIKLFNLFTVVSSIITHMWKKNKNKIKTLHDRTRDFQSSTTLDVDLKRIPCKICFLYGVKGISQSVAKGVKTFRCDAACTFNNSNDLSYLYSEVKGETLHGQLFSLFRRYHRWNVFPSFLYPFIAI